VPHWPDRASVSRPRSSNRTGGFPASGSRRRRHTVLAWSAACSLWTLSGVDRLTANLPSFAASCARLQPRPLPSAVISGVFGTTGLSVTRRGPARPSRAAGWPSRAAAAAGFPCLRRFPLPGMPPPLPRQDHAGQVAHGPARRRPSPGHRRVGSCIESFEACSAFTRVAACLLAESPRDPFHRRLRRLRCLRRRSDCYRPERPLAGRVSHPLRTSADHSAL